MALGPFAEFRGSGISNIRADIFVRTGKIGGAFAGSLSPYKKPVVLYDEGAVFTSEKPLAYAGTLLTEMHEDKRICQSGFAPVIPVE
jgi:CRISPR-associated protein Csm4